MMSEMQTPTHADPENRFRPFEPVAVAEWVARQTAEQEVGSIPPLLKHVCGEGDWLPCWHYTLAKVSHQRLISGNVYHVRLYQVRIRQNPLSGFETQKRRHQKSKTGVSVAPQMDMCPTKIFKKKKVLTFLFRPMFVGTIGTMLNLR